MALSKIGLVGCGILGGKIAGDFAYHGLEVWVYDQNNEVLDSLVVRLKYDKEKLWKDKLMMQTDFVGNVYYMSKLERVAKKSRFIFECVNEDLKIKQDVIERISHCCSPDAIIASSTMNLKLDEVFAKAVHPERCIGVRFLSPVYCIPEVELTLSSVTSNETLTKVQVFLGNMGKIPYFRTRNEAHLLTNEEKEARRIEYIKNFRKHRGHQRRLRPSISSLPPQDFLSTSYDDENRDRRGKECVVCLDAVRDSTLLPCFHVCVCTKCANMLKKKESYCPVCREEIKKIGPHYYP